MANTAEQTALALAPKFSAGLGLPCGVLLSLYIWRDQLSHKGNPMLRALLSVSFYEILDAMAWFLSTWAAPRETQWVWASGTQASCSLQGFFLQFVIGAPLSSCAMAFYFYLVVIHDKTQQDLARIERFILGGIFLYALTTSIVLLVLGQYNPIGAVCWVQGSPPLCGNSVYIANMDVPCDRGDWAWVYGMVLFYIPVWICYLCIIYCNFSIYWQIRSTPEGKWFALQSFYYGLAFCITWAPSTVWSALQWSNGGSFWLDLASAIFEPLAGFWNLTIFLRNRPKIRKELKNILCCCGTMVDPKDAPKRSTSDESETSDLSDEVMPPTPGEVKQAAAAAQLEKARSSQRQLTNLLAGTRSSPNSVGTTESSSTPPPEVSVSPLPKKEKPPRAPSELEYFSEEAAMAPFSDPTVRRERRAHYHRSSNTNNDVIVSDITFSDHPLPSSVSRLVPA
ncbi:hypothetical protein ACA910_008723 [Epithemia clementina (nom. ined.)]